MLLLSTQSALADDLFQHIPLAHKFALFKNFASESFEKQGRTIIVHGKLNGHSVSVSQDFQKAEPSIRVDLDGDKGVTADQLIPKLADVPAIDDLRFQNIILAERHLAVTINVLAKDLIDTRAEDLPLALIVKPTHVTIQKQDSSDNKGFSISRLIPDLADVPGAGSLSIDHLDFDIKDKSVSATGTLQDATATLSFDVQDSIKRAKVTLAAAKDEHSDEGTLKLTLGQFVPPLADAPIVNDFAFEKATFVPADKSIHIDGSLNTAQAELTTTFTSKFKPVTIDLKATNAINLGAVLPVAEGVPVINDFQFKDLSYVVANKTLSATGSLNDATATLALDLSKGIKSPGLSISAKDDITIAKALPVLADVPGVSILKFKDLSYANNTVALDMKIEDMEAVFALNFKDLKKALKTMTVAVTPKSPNNGFTLPELIPEISHLPGAEAIKVSKLAYDEVQKVLTANLNFNKKASATLTLDTEPKTGTAKKQHVFKLTSPDLNIGDIFPSLSGMSFFTAFGFDELLISPSYIETDVAIGGYDVHLLENIGKKFAAIQFPTLSADGLIPSVKGTVIADMKLSSSVFLLGAKSGTALQLADFPTDMQPSVNPNALAKPLKAGLNLLSSINADDLGKLATPLKKLGIAGQSLPLTGVLPTDIFHFISQSKKGPGTGKVAKKSNSRAKPKGTPKKLNIPDTLKEINVSLDLPIPKIPGVSNYAKLDDVLVSISGDLGDGSLWNKIPASLAHLKPTGDLDISLQGGITLDIADFNEDMQALANLNVGETTGELSLLAMMKGDWKPTSSLKDFTIKDAGFDISVSANTASTSAGLAFFASTKLNSTDNLALTASFKESDGKPALDYFELEGPVRFNDLNVLKNTEKFKALNDFLLNDIKIYPKGVEAKIDFKTDHFQSTYNLYVTEVDTSTGPALLSAIDLGFDAKAGKKVDISLGALAKMAGGLPAGLGKHLQGNLDGMGMAHAALVISDKSIPLLSPATLKSGVAKDLFTDIFGKSTLPVDINNITLLSAFDADLRSYGHKGLNLGTHGDAIINGSIGGIFDSDPLNLDLEIIVGEGAGLSGVKVPKFLSPKKKANLSADEKVGLFLKVLDETAEIGLLAGFDTTFGKTTFDFTGKLGVQLAEEDLGISLSGSMNDTWKNAFGIKHFELEQVAITGEIEEEDGIPSLKFGLGGETSILDRDFHVAGDISVGLIGEVPIPDGFGVKTESNTLDVTAYEIMNGSLVGLTALNLGTSVVGIPILVAGVVVDVGITEGGTAIYDAATGTKFTGKQAIKAPLQSVILLSKAQAWMLGGKDAGISFATPGASDTNIGIADGVRMNGTLSLLGGLITLKMDPDIGWIYKIAKAVAKSAAESNDPNNPAPPGADADITLNSLWPISTAYAADGRLSEKTKKQMLLLREIIAKELGFHNRPISINYPKPSKDEIAKFKQSLTFKDVGKFQLGGIDFDASEISLMPFRINARAKLFDAEEDVTLRMRDGQFVVETDTKLAGLADSKFSMAFDLEKKDFIVREELDANSGLQKTLAKEISDGIKEISASASAKFTTLNTALSKVQKLKKSAQKDLKAAQAAAEQVSKSAVSHLRGVTATYKSDYESAESSYNKCHGWKKYYCKSKWWPRKTLAWNTWQASKELLADAEKALAEEKALAANVSSAQIALTKAANDVALALKDVEAATKIKDVLKVGLDHFAGSAANLGQKFQFQRGLLVGSWKDLKQGHPFVLEADFTIDGKPYKEFFAFKPKDEAFNALALSLLPVIAAEHIVKDMDKELNAKLSSLMHENITDSSSKFTTWVKAHIYELVGGAREGIEKELAKVQYDLDQEENKFKAVFASFDKHAGKFAGGYQDLDDETNRILSTYMMTDFMPSSKTFNNRYLAVGHSALCLGIAKNNVDVYQQNCKDGEAEQWSAVSVKDANGGDTGYIQLRAKGLCLKAQNDNNTASGQPLILAACNGKDDHEKWRIVSKDGLFDKVVNRAAQKCLHFDTENANAKAGYTVWTSCFGADSEGFRIIRDAEKPTYYKVHTTLSAGNGGCLAPDADFGKYFTTTAKGASTSDKAKHNTMQQQRHDLLHVQGCNNKIAQFNYVENVNGTLKFVHGNSGWCIAADTDAQGKLKLAPCSADKNMHWIPTPAGDEGFTLKNTDNNQCMTLDAMQNGKPGTAALSQCHNAMTQRIEFKAN